MHDRHTRIRKASLLIAATRIHIIIIYGLQEANHTIFHFQVTGIASLERDGNETSMA